MKRKNHLPPPSLLVLASASPRRRELLSITRIPFTVQISNIEEIIDPGKPPRVAAMDLAARKATSVANELAASIAHTRGNTTLVLGADTIVVSPEGEILGKPRNEEHAIQMLEKLSGKSHQVITGIALALAGNHHLIMDHSITTVTMYDLTRSEIETYVALEKPYDLAGAYAIQGLASLFVKGIDGDYFNVVGLPLSLLSRHLRNFGYPMFG